MAEKMNIGSRQKSIKHDIIDKANSSMLIAVSVSVFVVVFCLFAAKTLISQSLYQNKVISGKQEALDTLEQSSADAEALQESYVAFATEPINVLGGSPVGTGPKDGDNAKLVLDALPSVLDFPALSSSIEKILIDGNYQIQTIGGDDKSIISDDSESGSDDVVSGTSEPAPIEFPFSINASPESTLNLLQTLERSIRPFEITNLTLEGSGNSLDVGINMITFYKPKVSLQVGSKVVE